MQEIKLTFKECTLAAHELHKGHEGTRTDSTRNAGIATAFEESDSFYEHLNVDNIQKYKEMLPGL